MMSIDFLKVFDLKIDKKIPLTLVKKSRVKNRIGGIK